MRTARVIALVLALLVAACSGSFEPGQGRAGDPVTTPNDLVEVRGFLLADGSDFRLLYYGKEVHLLGVNAALVVRFVGREVVVQGKWEGGSEFRVSDINAAADMTPREEAELRNP